MMLAFGLLGTLGALERRAPRRRRPTAAPACCWSVLAAMLPIAVAMAARPALYNGLRHFVFVVPPFAALGGLAVQLACRTRGLSGKPALAALAAVAIAGVALPAVGMVRLHPYEYTYFNLLAGGVRGAHGRYMLDYWGLAFKQAATNCARALPPRTRAPPTDANGWSRSAGRRPRRMSISAPQFETTFDQKQADFAMVLGTFYCRAPAGADPGADRARGRRLRARLRPARR